MVSRYTDALLWSIERLTQTHGPVALESPVYDFVETEYYQQTMGEDLKKQFVAFEQLVPPDAIVAAKINSNDLEVEYAKAHDHPETRPVNLDPGYISEAKLVLATTKDRDHRLVLVRWNLCRGHITLSKQSLVQQSLDLSRLPARRFPRILHSLSFASTRSIPQFMTSEFEAALRPKCGLLGSLL